MTKKFLDLVLTEVHTMKGLNHPNIVNLIEYGDNGEVDKNGRMEKVLYIVLELALGGELFDYVATGGRFPEPVARHYFKQLLSGLEYLHTKGVSHRDLKPENLLFDSDFNIKIADFGFSSSAAVNSTRLGTESYMAPEIHMGKAYSGQVCDLFAAAIILFIMVTQHPPFSKAVPNDPFYKLLCSNRSDLFWKAHARGKQGGIEFFSPEFMDLITTMLQYEPTHRLSLAELKGHPWFAGPTSTHEEVLEDFRLRKAKIDGAASQNTAPAPTAQANPNVFKQHRVQRSATEKGAGEEEEEESKLPVLKREVKPYVAVVNNVTTFFSSGDVERLFEVLACYCEAKANKFTFADDSYKVKMSFLDEHSHVEMSAKVLKVPEKEIFAVEFQRNKGDNFKFHEIYSEIHDYFGGLANAVN